MKKMLLTICAAFTAGVAQATGFIERFALAEDRGVILQELLPGSDDAFYYKALHELNQGDFVGFKATMEGWKRERQSQGWPAARARELLNREALLRYPAAPQESLKYITELLGLRFDHSRKDASRVVDLPSEFDNKLVARAGLLARSLKERPADLSLLEPAGHHLLQDAPLGEAQQLDLLKRLTRPDFKGLVALIAADLQRRDGAQFGALEIHSKLTLAQLEELADIRGELWRSERFVETYLTRLLPPDEVDLERELDQRDAYYARLWGALQNLIQDFNSRKANLLCNWIRNDLKRGEFNKERLLEYVKYPRAAPYAPRVEGAQRAYALDFNQQYNSRWLPPIGNEEPLVRGCLLRVFAEAPDYKEFAPYFKEEYLRALFAEAKITAGAGTPEQWIPWLSRSQYDAIKRRVDIEFADENPVVAGRDAPVVLSAYVKNVKSLIVKVYEINTENCFRESGVPIDLSMDLDGLTPTHEKVFQYSEADAIRVRREYQFPELQGRGVYIIELIGNGRSSRALVQKGHLKVVPAITAGGHAFTVFDEDGQPVKECIGWFNGAPFAAAQDGRIYIPFASVKDEPIVPLEPRAASSSTASGPGEKYLVVSAGNFSSLIRFNHSSESYTLEGGFYVDREALIAGELCEVVVRPRLALNGQSVALSLLKKTKLTLTSSDLDGVESKSVVQVPAFSEDADFVHQFRVPARCVRISFTLDGRVENMALNKEQELAASANFDFNASERGTDVRHLFLVRHSKGYTLEVRGKNGEAAADVPVQLAFKHRLFTREINASLKSDKAGLIQLGELQEIERLRGTWDGVGARQCTWNLEQSGCAYPQELHGAVNETLELAVPQTLNVAEDLALLELRGGAYVQEWRAALTCEDGMVKIKGLPAGDYELNLIGLGRKIPVRVTEAKADGRDLISQRRVLERTKLKPLTIAAVSSTATELRVQLANVSKYARVHLVAARYTPEFSLADHLSVAGGHALLAQSWRYPGCHYKSGRDIGDEYRYILERQQARKYPGNMLQRPGLLVAPWSTQTSEADKESLAVGEPFGSAADAKSAPAMLRALGGRAKRSGAAPADAIGACNFLKESAVTLYNLKPDAEGVLTVPLAALKGKPHLRIAAVDPESLVVREFALAGGAVATRDLRLAESLPAGVGYSEKQRATVLAAGGRLEIKDLGSARFEIYDTVGKLYNLFDAISNDPELKKFDFVANWPALEPKLKRELYSKYACHELNLFLYFKDQPFFESVIKPLVAAKKDKRFVDHWLIGADLGQYQSGYGYSRLNAAERALLAQRVAGRKAAIAREIREQVELLPADQERINRLFDTALQGRALDAGQGVEGYAEEQINALADGVRAMAATADKQEEAAFTGRRLAGRMRQSNVTVEAERAAPAASGAVLAEEVSERKAGERDTSAGDPFAAGLETRGTARQLYQRLESTKEWAENNYYELPIESQGPELISANVFWQEYAAHRGERGFVSGQAAEAANSLAEMMLALAVMDLPFEAAAHLESREGGSYKLQAASALVVYHREVLESERAVEGQALVAQRFFRSDDRYRYEGNERFDKTVTDEFLKRVVYGAQVVLTNPTGGRLKLRVLLQIPQGALPVLGGFYTKGFYVTLEPYATHMQEFFFYFPESGKYPHYPVTLSSDEQVIGEAAALAFNVVDLLSSADKESWGWISQNGSNAEVAEYLKRHNLYRIDLAEIAWRMKDKLYFQEVLSLLSERLVYDGTLWSYSLQHNVPERIAEYLARGAFATQCGLSIDSVLLKIDPVERNFYQHLEYAPLVNPRAHKVGQEHKILNQRFRANYERYMQVLACQPALSEADKLAVAWAMTLQDRIAEALQWFGRVERKGIAEQIQYDYLDAWLAFYRNDLNQAQALAERYADIGVELWRNRFELVAAQIKEIKGEAGLTAVDRRDRDQAQAALAATEPTLEMKVEGGVVQVKGANIKSCVLNFYPMDIELLFSRSPFVKADGSQFANIRPLLSVPVEIRSAKESVEVRVPESLAARNVMVEAVTAGVRRHQVYYASTLDVQLVERYGQLVVRHAGAGLPVPAVYVKVYARTGAGKVIFFKDGYTDLRGRFDYVSLNGNEIEGVEMLAVLVLSDELGAVVREVSPPAVVR
ncbi:MAG: hypothetical protein PHO37_10335 [Kiritimatiellae bacterium]|nr:hypothetical protein [Kiritimatiellia bacterium]